MKELHPLHNRMLRKHKRVTLALRHRDADGYLRLHLRDADVIDPNEAGDIMAVYTTSGRARESLHTAARNFYLCPKLMNLEKARGGCFLVQLGKCRGACVGQESPDEYNERFLSAFDNQRLHAWSYRSPVLITEEHPGKPGKEGFIVDQWCLVARLLEDEDGQVEVKRIESDFDLDMYKILRSFIEKPANKRHIKPLTVAQVTGLVDQLSYS